MSSSTTVTFDDYMRLKALTITAMNQYFIDLVCLDKDESEAEPEYEEHKKNIKKIDDDYKEGKISVGLAYQKMDKIYDSYINSLATT